MGSLSGTNSSRVRHRSVAIALLSRPQPDTARAPLPRSDFCEPCSLAHKAGDTAVGHPEAKADLEIATRLFPECRTMVCVAPARVGIVIDFDVLISRLSSAT